MIHKHFKEEKFIYLREESLNRCIKTGEEFKVECPLGEFVIDPKDWIKTGKVMYKVFKRPDEPMKLWGNWLTKKEDNKQDPLL